MKKIFLFDPIWSGHHPTYFKYFIKYILELGYQVYAFCPDPDGVNKWVSNNVSSNKMFNSFYFSDNKKKFVLKQKSLQNTFRVYSRWLSVLKKINITYKEENILPDLVLFPCLDNFMGLFLSPLLLDVLFPYKWSGLYFNPSYLRLKLKYWFIRRGFLKKDIIIKSSRCKAIAILDEGIIKKCYKSFYRKPVVLFPDFADLSTPDNNFIVRKQIKEKSNGRKIIGIVGSLSKRKGMLILMEVARLTREKPWFFVFAGKLVKDGFNDEELKAIKIFKEQKNDNCFFSFNYIPDESKVNAIIELCDIVFAAYIKFPHSSNFITKSAFFKKKVIVSKGYCMGERIHKYSMGLDINENSVSDCINAINFLFNKKNKINPRYNIYLKINSQEQLKKSIEKLIRISL